MLYVKPDYFDSFHCIAGECKHSCCVGWEIDIDEDTYALYSQLEGELGKELREKISAADEQPHFVLEKDERCPFLREDGLCRLILGLGEDSLCEICAEHPRYYNFTDRVEEMGLGACCEEAARLILEGERGIELVWENDGEDEGEAGSVFSLREKLLTILADTSSPLSACLERAAALCGGELALPQMGELSRFLGTLERMEEHWGELVEGLAGAEAVLPDTVAVRRIAQYFLCRYFCAGDGADELTHLRFAALSTLVICAIAHMDTELAEALRLYSTEIEYSDENVGKIYAFLN